MSGPQYSTAVLFGGAGFIGSHLTEHLLSERKAERVVVADLRRPSSLHPGAEYVEVDVRRDVRSVLAREAPDLIVNLAAVHREPGHEHREYFETNVLGAENVTAFAVATGCKTLVFTSSISVYGPTEQEKDEASLPTPTTAYGASKLVAERVHLAWQQADLTRMLVIVRPGVVFGPGEGGNVTRLVKAVVGGYFVYCANHHVRKAGGYVKELLRTIDWAIQTVSDEKLGSLTYNFTSMPTPRLDEFVGAIASVAGKHVRGWSVPFFPVLAASHVAEAAGRVFGLKQPLHPVRAHKLVRSNHISSAVLRRYHYQPKYDLASSLEDWKRSEPADWGIR